MNDRLNRAVEALLSDGRLLRRFRRKPDRALRAYGLTAAEIEAVKRGDAAELLALGLDPALVWPKAPTDSVFRRWLLAHPQRLAPVAFAVAVIASAPAAAGAARGRRISLVHRERSARIAARALLRVNRNAPRAVRLRARRRALRVERALRAKRLA